MREEPDARRAQNQYRQDIDRNGAPEKLPQRLTPDGAIDNTLMWVIAMAVAGCLFVIPTAAEIPIVQTSIAPSACGKSQTRAAPRTSTARI
jgi:hypothetical protein